MKKFIAIITIIVALSMAAEASTRICGEPYRFGWTGSMYIHKTKSMMYDKGEPTRNAYRWHNGRLYYFDNNGVVLRHSTKYIKVENGHVKHIYVTGTNHNERYNVKHRRYQVRKKNGHWMDVGNQTNIWWMCDMQE